MKQLYLKCIILGFFALMGIKAAAYDCKVDGIYYNLNKTEKTASVTYYSSSKYSNSSAYKGDVTIPSSITYNGTTYSVSTIGQSTFYYCSGLTSVTIPNSVTSIGNQAFSSCSGLSSITIPNSVTSIGERAFEDCSSLTSINIPNSVTTIGQSAFSSCLGLTSVNIGNSVTTIEQSAFQECSSLTSINIPNSVTTIGQSAFYGCKNLTSVSLSNGLTSVGGYAFYGCNGLASVSIPKGVTSIQEWTFYGCRNLTSISIPNSVTSIGDNAFGGCNSLTSVTIPNNVTRIGGCAFSGCSSLTSVTIPKSVTNISPSAFISCELESIVVASGNTIYDSRNQCNAIIETATNTLITGCNGTTIPSSVTSIGDYAFSSCHGLTSITIPNSVTSIGEHAFESCSGLTSINIPNGLTSIQMWTFSGCISLTSVTIPSSVISIDYYAFGHCVSLTSVTISNGVTTIGSNAFSDCSSLTSIEIPSSVTSIGSSAFWGCSGLTSIEIPSSVTSIGSYVFYGCSGLTSISIPSSVTSIGSSAFSRCSGLTSIEIPSSVTSIGERAFEGCKCYVICNREDSPTAYDGTFNENMIAFVPEGSASIYQQATGWKIMSINPFCYLEESTQSTISLRISNLTTNVKATLNGVSYYPKNGIIKIIGLEPSTEYTISLSGDIGNYHTGNQFIAMTKDLSLGIELVKRTNLTLRLKGYNVGDAVFSGTGFEGYEGQNEILIKDLVPGRTYYYTYYVVTPSGKKFSTTNSFQTLPITLNVSANTGPSSALLSGSSNIIDATVTDYGFDGYPEQNPIKITGLDPNKSYSQTFYIITKEGGRVSKSVTFTTKSLTLTTSQPKVISAGNVIVAAESNLDDEETNMGFEWRRIDYTSEFPSYTGTAYLYNGTMEGYIRSLYTEKLWKYRPYYTSNAGNTYYSEWVGIDPTNTSYFEPTVHTYANVSVNGNSAEVKGYVQRGTGNVVSKGFVYWEQSQGVKSREVMSAPSMISSLPSNAKTVEISGSQQVMTASLPNLEYETTYCYVAFVRTSEGDTFYGEEMTFTSGESPYTLGDVNGDKEIDISDVVAMVNHILGNTSSTSFKPQAADINKDGNIDISDVVSLVNIILAQ